ncbi:17886_t:CDS:2, partial [Acaulospora morrowiae]
SVDNFIVYFHGLLFDDHEEKVVNNFDELVNVWKEIEILQHHNKIKKPGVSEFTKDMLEKLLKVVKVPPKINQINIKPCELPKDMDNFAKEHGIELLFHRDPK